jgi:tetratricopeptide (TPR) repeat protein
MEAAAKLVAKGAWDKALKEYQKIIDVDPKDVRVLQKMGEAHQKKGDNPQAAKCFIRVAESYTSDGFFLKAVALYKQVLKLDPSLIEINLKLAELHQQLQLMGDAMGFYQIVANHYDKAGDSRKSLDVLKKMVELDPDNIASRVKLADLYVRDGLNEEAAAQFRRASDHLKKTNRLDDYVRVAERLSALEPNNLPLARELAEHYLQRNDQKRALAKLQVCFKADARDVETLSLLAIAFEGLGQTSKTLSVYKELGRAQEEKGNLKASQEAWAKAEKVEPNDPDVLARKPKAAPERPAFAPPVPQRLSTNLSSPSRVKPESVGKLLTETDVYLKYGLHDKALEHLRRIFATEPENIDAHEKAYAIYVASNNEGQAFEQLLNVLRLHTRNGNGERAQPYLNTILQQNPNHPEVSVFLSALSGEPNGEVDDEAVLVESDDEVIVADESEEVLPAVGSLPDEEDEVIEEIYESEAGLAPDEVILSEEDAARSAEFPVDPPPVFDAPEGDQTSYTFDADEPLRANEDEVIEEIDDEPVSQYLDEQPVEFGTDDVETGFLDTYRAPADPAFESSSSHEAESYLVDDPVAEECDEAAFFLEQGLLAEARDVLETISLAYPDHPRAAVLMLQLAAVESEASSVQSESAERLNEESGSRTDAFVLAAQLAGELGDASAEPLSPQNGGDDYQVSVEEVFAEFKKGLEKVVKPEDVDTHYDLGVAYKEMGLIEDAVGEFAIARKGCIGKRKELDCLSMMGLMQTMQGAFDASIASFKAALACEFAKGDTEKALRYDLALAYEGSGSAGRALGQFNRIGVLDVAYRDIQQHIERLAQVASPEDDFMAGPSVPAPRGRKVGYI